MKKQIKQITINLKEWETTEIEIEQVREAIRKVVARKIKKEADIFITYREIK